MIKKIIIVLVILLISAGIFYTNNLNVYKFKDEGIYTFLSGKEYSFDGDLEMIYENQDKTIMEYKNKNYILTGIPLYFNDENKIVLTKNMLFVDLQTGNIRKVNRFTSVYREDNNIILEEGTKKKVANNFFLYDGINTYINFSTGAILEGNKEYIVDHFSFVEGGMQKYFYNYNNDIIRQYTSNSIDFGEGISLDLINNILSINDKQILLLNEFENIKNFL